MISGSWMLEDWQLWEELHLSSVPLSRSYVLRLPVLPYRALLMWQPQHEEEGVSVTCLAQAVSVHRRLLWLDHMLFTLCEQRSLPLGLSGWLTAEKTAEVGAGYLWPLVPDSGINWLFLQNKSESRVLPQSENTTGLLRNGGNTASVSPRSHNFMIVFLSHLALEVHRVWMTASISFSYHSVQPP